VALVSRVLRLLGPALLAVLAVGCEPEPTRIELPDAQLMVFGVLEAGADTAFVRLSRIWVDGSAWSGIRREAVPGAQVEIHGDDDGSFVVLRAATEGERARCFGPLSGGEMGSSCHIGIFSDPIRQGARYTLHAVLPTGERVTGNARVPAAPVLHEPGPGSRAPGLRAGFELLSYDAVRLAWNATASTAAVAVSASAAEVFGPGTPADGSECRFSVTEPLAYPQQTSTYGLLSCSAWLGSPPGATYPIHLDSVRVRIVVTAYDSAFVRYHAATNGHAPHLRWRDLAEGLTGAVGLFTGAAPAEATLLLWRRDPTAEPRETAR
jgi:hypothetical protein